MNKDKINLLITEALDNDKLNLTEWVTLRLENNLNPEELNYLKIQDLKYNISKILHFESRYLGEEELMHKISQINGPQITIPLVIQVVSVWHEKQSKLKNLKDTFDFLHPYFEYN
jgi:hypothetical protein